MSAKTHCMSQRAANLRRVDRLENRMKSGAGSTPAAADWINGCVWCSVLIKCLGGGALTMHNYFTFQISNDVEEISAAVLRRQTSLSAHCLAFCFTVCWTRILILKI